MGNEDEFELADDDDFEGFDDSEFLDGKEIQKKK